MHDMAQNNDVAPTVTVMTTDQESNSNKNVAAVWKAVIWAGWGVAIVGSTLWSAYAFGQNISANLTEDYNKVQASQQTLLLDSQEFLDGLLNPDIDVPKDSELKALKQNAGTTIAVLAGMRTPGNRIENAKHEYRDALQDLLAVANRISRGEVRDMATPLHNALQSVANKGSDFNNEINYFQSGMWPQLKASVF